MDRRVTASERRPLGLSDDGEVDLLACAAIARAAVPGSSATGLVALTQRLRACSLVRRAWRWARFARRYRPWPLRVEALALTPPPDRAPDCAACAAACCHAPHLVSLRLSDIARLLDAGLGWAMVPPPSRREAVYREHPALALLEARDTFRCFPVLRQTCAGACVFLGRDHRCAIHPLRPLACRRFPYVLDDDLRTIRWASTCPHAMRDEGAHVRYAAAVVTSYNEKLSDLQLLQFEPAAVIGLGLARYLPGQPGRRARGRIFAAALTGARMP